MKNTISVLLLIAILSGMTSCTQESTDETNEKSDTQTEEITESAEPVETVDPAVMHDLPEGLSFDGATFNLLCSAFYSYSGLNAEAELNGEIMNDTRYEMIHYTMDTLDVVLNEDDYDLYTCANYLENLIAAGDTTYDCVNFMDRYALQCAMNNCLITLDNVEYLDFSKDYWGEGISNSLSIANKLYFGSGSFQLKLYEELGCVLFNNAVADNYQVEIPFDDVDNGTWTLDKLVSYKGIATADMDGDGVTDQWTYGSDPRALPMQLLMGSGIKIIEKGENDIPYLKVFGDVNFVDTMDRIRSTFFEGDMISDTSSINLDGFVQNKQLINVSRFSFFHQIRDQMETSFSILPIPKADETQENYITRSYDSTLTCVPITAPDTDKTGAVLECLNSYGYRYLVPAYIENVLGGKLSGDERSSRNVKLIYETRAVEMGEAYMFERFGDVQMFNLINKSNVASYLAAIKKTTENDLAEIVAAFTGEQKE